MSEFSMHRCSAAIAVALVFAIFVAPGPLRADTKVRLAVAKTAMLVWVTERRGFFEDEGLDVEITLFQSGLAASNAVLEGAADLSTTSESGFVGQSFEHPELRVLATISASESARLVGRRDRGILAARDLAGQRIGITKGTTGEILLGRYLTLHRLSLDDVELVDLRAPEIAAELVAGGIDAGLTWEPHVYIAETELGDNAVTLPDQDGQHFYFLLLSTQSWIQSNPAATDALLRAFLSAERFAIENETAAKALIAEKLDFESDYVDHIWPLHSLRLSLPQDLLFRLEETARWRLQEGLTRSSTMPNYIDLIETRFMRELRPSAVGIVR